MAGTPQGVVILGFPRSGTTLLSRLLNGHPDISSPPETYLLSSAARFLYEQSDVEGPPIGVLSGLAFLGFEPEDIRAPLRKMIFDIHAKIAGDAKVWVEKTAIDIFHLDKIEELLAGHVRFITLVRHPLDVIASNMDLAGTMGAQLTDIFTLTQSVNGPHEGLAQAWVDRQQALDRFAKRHGDDCLRLRYEDLLTTPEQTFGRILQFMDINADPAQTLKAAFSQQPQIGLGDYKVNATTGIAPLKKNGWRKKIPPAATARILPQLTPLMEQHGYAIPRVPKSPNREDAVRQFVMAAQFKRDRSRDGTEGV